MLDVHKHFKKTPHSVIHVRSIAHSIHHWHFFRDCLSTYATIFTHLAVAPPFRTAAGDAEEEQEEDDKTNHNSQKNYVKYWKIKIVNISVGGNGSSIIVCENTKRLQFKTTDCLLSLMCFMVDWIMHTINKNKSLFFI